MDRVGQRVGPYEIDARVWVPEPGVWYAGRDDSGDQVLVRFATRPDEAAELQRQQDVLAAADDPRLPEGAGWDPDHEALLVRGGLGATLGDAIALRVVSDVTLTPGTLVDLLIEVCGALSAVHEAGEVHGHLAPRCIVLEPNGALWVYGVGAVAPPDPAFLPPELARGQPATGQTDQWAVGALGIALVLGHPPWRSEEPLAEALQGDLGRALEAIGRQWPALSHVLGRMVAADPAARFPALDDAADALAGLAAVAGPSERESLAQALASVPPPPLADDDGVGGAPTAVPISELERPSSGWLDDPDEDDDDDPSDDRVLDRFGSCGDPADRPLWPGTPPSAPEREDPDFRPELTDPVGWFETPTPAPASWQPDRDLSVGQDISLAPEPAPQLPSPTGHLLIVRLAPLLAAGMVVLLVVWLVVRIL
ncbi:MAG: hypothetical protein R3F59_11040 [Myxococcota bacterium]